MRFGSLQRLDHAPLPVSDTLSRERLGLQEADRARAVPELFADYVAVVRRLRRECPWDREQTHASVRHLLLEEAYEAADAIAAEDWEALRGELGDLLLHVVFHAEIAESTTGAFVFEDVVRHSLEKLVRRHPHVFGDTTVAGTAEVLRHWERLKQAEHGPDGARRSALAGVPRALPALLRAHRVQEKAAGVGFDFASAEGAWSKVEEELRELRSLVEAGAPETERERELGDLLFALVNYARLTGVNAENALRATTDTFQRRFAHVEARLAETGRSPHDASLEEMDRYWEEAKAAERAAAARPAPPMPTPPLLDPDAIDALLAEGVPVVDTRSPEAFRRGHVPGALLALPEGPGWSYVPRDRPVVLVAETDRLEALLRRAEEEGVAVSGVLPEEALEAWGRGNDRRRMLKGIDFDELDGRRHYSNVLVLDVRPPEAWAAHRVPNSLNVPHEDLPGRLAELPRDKTILVHCQDGTVSAVAAALLHARGFCVAHVADDLAHWHERHLAPGAQAGAH